MNKKSEYIRDANVCNSFKFFCKMLKVKVFNSIPLQLTSKCLTVKCSISDVMELVDGMHC
jgi:hypothetical protein